MNDLTNTLRIAIKEGGAVIRFQAALEPAAGGNKVLPPTYSGGKHNMTALREDGTAEWCSIDSPASFANRVEAAIYGQHPELAPLRVRVDDVRSFSTMELPHRAFDATLRDSMLNDASYTKTAIYKQLSKALPDAAYALLQYDPSVLLLGAWNSTELGKAKSAQPAKWPAALSCEIAATDVLPVSRAGSRIDPLGIAGTDASIVEDEDGTLRPYDSDADADGELPVRPEKENNIYPRRVKPSQVNLGNVTPDVTAKGVLVRGGISLHGMLDLRRLGRYHFAPADDVEARLLLTLMGLYGVAATLRNGLDLRRDCELIAVDTTASLLNFCAEPVPLPLNVVDIDQALTEQVSALSNHIADPVELTPSATLRSLLDQGG